MAQSDTIRYEPELVDIALPSVTSIASGSTVEVDPTAGATRVV